MTVFACVLVVIIIVLGFWRAAYVAANGTKRDRAAVSWMAWRADMVRAAQFDVEMQKAKREGSDDR